MELLPLCAHETIKFKDFNYFPNCILEVLMRPLSSILVVYYQRHDKIFGKFG